MSTNEMKLKTLYINLNESWQARPGHYSGQLEFVGAGGNISVPLDEALSMQVLALVSSNMLEATRNLVNLMADQISMQTVLLAPPKDSAGDDCPF